MFSQYCNKAQNSEIIEKILCQRLMYLDGAMGTRIQTLKFNEQDFRGDLFRNHSLDLVGNNDLLTLTKPNDIQKIHYDYLKAGCDLICTNTFNSTPIAQKDYKLESLVFDLNKKAVELAKAAIAEYRKEYKQDTKPLFVVGSIGPTNKTASISPRVEDPSYREVSFDDLVMTF